MKLLKRLTYVLDASVILKWHTKENEKNIENAYRLREDFRTRKIEIIAPELLIYEVANVLRYKSALEEKLILNAITGIYEMRILRPANEDVMKEAVRLARKYDITVYDSAYISLANNFGCSLITADKKLLEKIGLLSNILFLNKY
ncbi:MAG: type II toxin-antitoxin system VapC family toxin [bacterium]